MNQTCAHLYAESCTPFEADRGLRMDIVVEREGVADASTSCMRQYTVNYPAMTRKRGFTCVPPVLIEMDQVLKYLRRERVTTTLALDNHHTRVGYVPFNEARPEPCHYSGGSLRRLCLDGSELIGQLETNMGGGRNRVSVAKTGTCKEPIPHNSLLASQVMISLRVDRYNIEFPEGHARRRRREDGRGFRKKTPSSGV